MIFFFIVLSTSLVSCLAIYLSPARAETAALPSCRLRRLAAQKTHPSSSMIPTGAAIETNNVVLTPETARLKRQ